MSERDSAFWRFSLRLYRRPEVPALCLDLQDQFNVDVNLLFFILFLAINERQLTLDDVRRIDTHVCAWRSRVVQRLRALRRDLKGGVAPMDMRAAEALRNAIKRNELQAERLQQEALEREFPAHATGSTAAPRVAAAANIKAYGSLIGALPNATINALLTALTAEFSV